VGLVLQDPEAQLVNLLSLMRSFGPENLKLPVEDCESWNELLKMPAKCAGRLCLCSIWWTKKNSTASGLAMKPEVLLLDGPYNLDPEARKCFRQSTGSQTKSTQWW
jgi:energy-coupling factor transporter ATP-binding protein EcfA2